MERLVDRDPAWIERDRLNQLTKTELEQCLIDAHIDMVENPYRAFDTNQTATIAAQILYSRYYYFERNFND